MPNYEDEYTIYYFDLIFDDSLINTDEILKKLSNGWLKIFKFQRNQSLIEFNYFCNKKLEWHTKYKLSTNVFFSSEIYIKLNKKSILSDKLKALLKKKEKI